MPLITFESGKLPEEVKEKLNQKLTKLAAEITGIPESSFWVFETVGKATKKNHS